MARSDDVFADLTGRVGLRRLALRAAGDNGLASSSALVEASKTDRPASAEATRLSMP